MKPYREYIIYCMKSVSTAILAYASFSFFVLTFLHVNLSVWLFPAGILLVTFSIISHTAGISREYAHLNSLSILVNILSAGIFALAVYLTAHDIVVSAASAVYGGYLWRAGWGISQGGLMYLNYKQSLLNGLLFMIAVITASTALSYTEGIPQFSRFTAAYFITGIILLRSAREYQYLGEQKNRRAYAVNTIINVSIVLLILLASSGILMSYLSAGLKYIWSLIDEILMPVIKVISYPLIMLLTAIVKWLNSRGFEMPVLSEQGIPPDALTNDNVRKLVLSPAVLTVIKILVLAAAAFLLFKIASRHYKRGRMKDEFYEEREFIYNPGSITDSIKKALSSLFHRKDRPKPRTLAERIRYLYYDFLELNVKSGTYRSISDTPRDIKHRSLEYLDGEGENLGEITRLYEAARYGRGNVGEDDFSSMKSRFEEVSRKYNEKCKRE